MAKYLQKLPHKDIHKMDKNYSPLQTINFQEIADFSSYAVLAIAHLNYWFLKKCLQYLCSQNATK